MSLILGLSFSHNASACLVDRNGTVIAAASEERFTRRKNEWGIPVSAIEAVLSGIKREQVSKIAVGELCRSKWATRRFAEVMYLEPLEARDRLVRGTIGLGAFTARELAARLLGTNKDYRELVEANLRRLGFDQPVDYVEHHLAHAASAYFAGPSESALAVTLDGEGDRKSGGVWDCSGTTMTRLCDLDETRSVGKFYRAITSLLGFRINRHEGKVTGLAAFGNAVRFRAPMETLLGLEEGPTGPLITSAVAKSVLTSFSFRDIHPGKLIGFADLAVKATSWEALTSAMLRRHFAAHFSPRFDLDWSDLSFQDKADLAAAAQERMETVVLDWVGAYLERTGRKSLVLAGGVFANVKLNQRLLERLPVDEVFIQPAMGDEGLAMGAAMLAQRETARDAPGPFVMRCASLGTDITPDGAEMALDNAGIAYERLDIDALAERAAAALAKHKIVGLAHGQMEFGPRALGQRTLLAHPGEKSINETLNHRLRRTDFMPFAPVVLADMFEEIFEGPKLDGARLAVQHMTITLSVKPEWHERLAGVVHVDGTARPQVIDENSDPLYYAILRRFHELTGLGCLVNTSFNLHEEPIIAIMSDALRAFDQGAADLLIAGRSVVEQN